MTSGKFNPKYALLNLLRVETFSKQQALPHFLIHHYNGYYAYFEKALVLLSHLLSTLFLFK